MNTEAATYPIEFIFKGSGSGPQKFMVDIESDARFSVEPYPLKIDFLQPGTVSSQFLSLGAERMQITVPGGDEVTVSLNLQSVNPIVAGTVTIPPDGQLRMNYGPGLTESFTISGPFIIDFS